MEKETRASRLTHQAFAYALTVAAAAGVQLGGAALRHAAPGGSYALLFAAVTVVAAYGGFAPGFLATLLGTSAVGFQVGPRVFASMPAALPFLLTVGSCILISALCQHARSAAAQARILAQTQGDLLRRERAAEERYEELLERLDAIVWEADEQLQLLRISRRVGAVFGYSVVDCLTEKDFWARVLPDEALAAFRECCARVRKSGVDEDWEHPFLANDGRRLWVRSRISLGRAEEGAPPVICGSMADVTERRSTEVTLQQSEDWYRRIVDTAFEGIWLLDGSGKTAFVNDRMAQMLGYPAEVVMGKPWFEFTNRDDRVQADRYFQQIRRGRKLQRDFRLKRADGSTLWALASASAVLGPAGEFNGILAMVTEVTDRKRAEEALRFLAEASGMLTSSLDYVATLEHVARLAVPTLAEWCVVDVTEGDTPPRRLAVAHADAATEARLRSVTEREPLDLNAPLPIAEVLRTGNAALLKRLPRAVRISADRAGLQPGSAMIVPLIARGRTLGAISFVRSAPGQYEPEDMVLAEDLARRAAIALDNARLYQEVRRADRAKDEFLAMLAHELRNPLAPIRNAVQLLRQQPEDSSTVRRVREVVDRQVRHMTRLTDDLLDVSRITRGKIELRREPLDLVQLARDVLEDHQETLEKARVVARAELPDAPVWVDGDATRLAQVIGNLLVNACKFTDPGGSVTLGVEPQLNGEQVRVCVRDTGIGIPTDVLPHVFEAFTQADGTLDRSRGGLGLGLAVVKGLVELHGGEVLVNSAGVGQGSELTFVLPTLAGPGSWVAGLGSSSPGAGAHPELLRRERPAPAIEDPGLTVLVIEDNIDAAETLQDLLEASGHRVTLAHTGLAGVDAARRLRPDVILCDIGLPGLDGYGVAAALRQDENTRDVRLVAVTGYGQEEDRRRSREAGFDLHLTKPVDPAVLEEYLNVQLAAAR